MKTLLISIGILLGLAGCASSGDYKAYLTAQQAENVAYKNKPILILEGFDNQPITGLKRVEVNLPGQAPIIQQAKDSEWAGVFNRALGVVGTIGGIWAGGEAAKGLAGAVGNAANHGYQYIQTPAANITTTTTLSGTGTLGSGSYSTDTHAVTSSYNPAPVTTDNSNQGNPVTYPVTAP